MAHDTIAGNFPGTAHLPAVPRQPHRAADLTYAVECTLTDFLTTQVDALQSVDPALGGLAHTTRDLVLAGGKRLRPTFAYWGWRGVVGPHEAVTPVLPALASLELMHAFALVHDDVMDESATRRGRPTAHRIFAGQHAAAGRVGDPRRFGAAAAVLLGDLCLVWADKLLAESLVTCESLFAVRACYDQMRIEAVAGQYLDVLGEAQPDAWSVERALLVARYKTASYTVQRPLQFGAALADAENRLAAGSHTAADQTYSHYGAAVGEAFQLRDDILGVYGDPTVTGKPAGDDLRTGKPTTLMMLARQLADPAQLAELDRGRAATESAEDSVDIERLADVIAETGAVTQVESLIRQRVTEGVDALAEAPIHDDARHALTELAVAATHRPS